MHPRTAKQYSVRMARPARKFSYLLFLVTPMLPLAGWWLGRQTGAVNFFAWFTAFYIFLLIPVADYLIGQDPINPDANGARTAGGELWYKLLLWSCVPLMLSVLPLAGYLYVTTDLTWIGATGWIVSMGLVSSTIAINAAHELIHKPARAERAAGGLLLSLVCYGGFKVEHVRGHHVHVSTPADASSARRGQTVYGFVPRALLHNFINAWELEAARLRYRGLPPLHWRNELIWWYALSLAVATFFTTWLGLPGLLFFVGQSLVACAFLEVVNYLEHYGLQRRLLSNGRFERTTHLHSWNSNYLLTNLLLFQLQRHSDHHENPTRVYQLLRHYDASPQLPAGYATMMLIALVPPLWRRIMHPRLDAFYSIA